MHIYQRLCFCFEISSLTVKLTATNFNFWYLIFPFVNEKEIATDMKFLQIGLRRGASNLYFASFIR